MATLPDYIIIRNHQDSGYKEIIYRNNNIDFEILDKVKYFIENKVWNSDILETWNNIYSEIKERI